MAAAAGGLSRSVMAAGLVAWSLTLLLVIASGATPYATPASALQVHGALQRDGGVGIISHRGAASLAPENTLASMRLAIEQGTDFVETDVRLTSDGVPILMHDPRIDRTTAGTGRVAYLTLAEIRTFEAGSWFDPAFAGEPVPTLEEFATLLDPVPTRALIELKGKWTAESVDAMLELMRAHQLVNRVVLQSFELPTLRLLQQEGPEFARLLLTRGLTDETAATAIELQVSAVGSRDDRFADNPEFVQKMRSVGIGTAAYTLNSEAKWGWAAELGIDLVVTDDAVALGAWRDADGETEGAALDRDGPQE